MPTTKRKDHIMIQLEHAKKKLNRISAYQEMKNRRDDWVKEFRSVKHVLKGSKRESSSEECKSGPQWDDEGRWLDDGGGGGVLI
jgi:hypothetical protein